MRVAETKALISFAVTAKLICVFVFAYAKTRFSHDAAQIVILFSDQANGALALLTPINLSQRSSLNRVYTVCA